MPGNELIAERAVLILDTEEQTDERCVQNGQERKKLQKCGVQ